MLEYRIGSWHDDDLAVRYWSRAMNRPGLVAGLWLFFSSAQVYAAPDTTMSITPTATSGATITASDENSRNSAISTAYNAHSHTDLTKTTANTFTIGNSASGAKSLLIADQFTTSPSLRYLDTSEEWQYSNNASTFVRMSSWSETHAKSGSFTRDLTSASGNQSITGVGFKPAWAVFFAERDNIAGEASWGLDAGAGPNGFLDNYSSTVNSYANTSISIYLQESTTTNNQQGKVASFDADGFTISWTKAGTPTGTGTISYLVGR